MGAQKIRFAVQKTPTMIDLNLIGDKSEVKELLRVLQYELVKLQKESQGCFIKE